MRASPESKRDIILAWSHETDVQRHALKERVNKYYIEWQAARGTMQEHIALPYVRGGTPLERLMYALDDYGKHVDRRLDIEGDEIYVYLDYQEEFTEWARQKGML